MLLNFDRYLNLRDFYYPYVGMENHVGGFKCSLGIWADGRSSWLDDGSWEIKLRYQPGTLVYEGEATNYYLGLRLVLSGTVHHLRNFYLVHCRVYNLRGESREIKLFFHQDFSLGGNDVGDTVLFDPISNAILQYKRNFYLLIGGQVKGKEPGFDQFTTGLKRFGHHEGTWRDIEDGLLAGQPIAQGSVDSTIGFNLRLGEGEVAEVYYWIAVGSDLYQARTEQDYILTRFPEDIIQEVAAYWRNWLAKGEMNFADLSEELVELYRTSLLIIRTHVDNRGAIIAASDTDIMVTNRDHYAYLWPRDGALIADVLAEAGYPELSFIFYRLCPRLLTPEGYFWPKYHPDGSVGSSWHPWWQKGRFQLPIQEDETALVIWALTRYLLSKKELEPVKELYEDLIVPAAHFLAHYRDPYLGLPLPSYDLWEERLGIFTFTAATVSAALQGAAGCARLMGDLPRALCWEEAAAEVKRGIHNYLYHHDLGRYVRGLYQGEDNRYLLDTTYESSVAALYLCELFPVDNERVERTMESTAAALQVRTGVGGIARYHGDYYFRRSDDLANVPGNPWFVTTFWLAEWQIRRARSRAELQAVKHYLEWANRYKLPSGVLAEQLHPYSGEPLSVAPLIWSHAAYVKTVLSYCQKYFNVD